MVTMQWIPVDQVLEEWDDEAEEMVTRRFHRPSGTPPRPTAPTPQQPERQLVPPGRTRRTADS